MITLRTNIWVVGDAEDEAVGKEKGKTKGNVDEYAYVDGGRVGVIW